MSMAERKTMTRAVKNPVKRKLTRAEKKEIAAVIQAAKGDGKPHTAQQTIPYLQMYPDGICRVTEKKYSTLNLICTVLLRPSMQSLLSIPRVWDTSQQAIFNRRAAGQEGENTEVGTRFLCLLRNFLPLSLLHGKSDFAKAGQKKNAANCDV